VVTHVEHVMGMPVVFDVRDGAAAAEAIGRAAEWLHDVDRRFSTYMDDSEVSRVARGELDVEDAHPDVRAVLARCEELRSETRGYFDAYAAGALDPSGLVKGWAVDRAAALLEEGGLRRFAVNAGGDIRVHGAGWRVGIQHPREPGAVAKVVVLDDAAVATSGAYERGEHVVDPHTGAAPRGVLSVTITGPDLATADAYATAAYAMGAAGPAWTARLRGYEAMTILDGGRVLCTPGFPGADPDGPDHEKRRDGGAFVHPTDRPVGPEGLSEPLGGAST
jgi:FAD:protein FMN transferase